MSKIELKLWVDGGTIMRPRSRREVKGIYWSMRCEEHGTAPFFIRKQDLKKYKTNNDAEWCALLEGLRHVVDHHPNCSVLVHSDSQLVVNQFNNIYKCRIIRHARFRARAHAIAVMLPRVTVKWVPRKISVSKLGH